MTAITMRDGTHDDGTPYACFRTRHVYRDDTMIGAIQCKGPFALNSAELWRNCRPESPARSMESVYRPVQQRLKELAGVARNARTCARGDPGGGQPMSRVTATCYIVRVDLLNVGPFAGRTDTRRAYLSDDSGYLSHSSIKEGASRFKKPPTAAQIAQYDGKPWYDKHDTSQRAVVFRVTESREEVAVLSVALD